VHNSLMISAHASRCAEPYIIIVGWTDGENSAFWVHKSKRVTSAYAGTVIGEVHKAISLTDSTSIPAFALVHNSLMISAMHPGGAELYITHHCWVDRWGK
jgi:hypothetical protein